MFKRIMGVVSALVIVTMLLGISAYARYSYTAAVSCSLTISNKTAYCDSTAVGMNGVTKILATQYLEKKMTFTGYSYWETVSGGTWSNTVNGYDIEMINSKSSLTSGTYRLRTVFTVYSGTSYETVEKISAEKTI